METNVVIIIEKFAIPNLGPQETQYTDLRRNLSSYNRTRNTNSDILKNGESFGSNDSLSNLQKNFRDIRIGNSHGSSRRITPESSEEGRNSSVNWVDKLTIKEESFNKNTSGSRFNKCLDQIYKKIVLILQVVYSNQIIHYWKKTKIKKKFQQWKKL